MKYFNKNVFILILIQTVLFPGVIFSNERNLDLKFCEIDPIGVLSTNSVFGTNVNSTIKIGSDIFAGGYFEANGGFSVAKWDGNSWMALGGGVKDGNGNPGTIYSMTAIGTDLYVAGLFETAGTITVNNIAKWNGSSWSSLDNGLVEDGIILCIASHGSDLYVGGSFRYINGDFQSGVFADNIAKWDGNSWSALDSGLNGLVRSIASNGSTLFVGGEFELAGALSVEGIARWNGSTWGGLGNGLNNGGYVKTIAIDGPNVYIAGVFEEVSGINARNIAKWNGAFWSPLDIGLLGNVNVLIADNNMVYAGGSMRMSGYNSDIGVKRWDGTNWQVLSTISSGNVESLYRDLTKIYAGGRFNEGSSTSDIHIGTFDENCQSIEPEINCSWEFIEQGLSFSAVKTSVYFNNELYIGGDFDINGQPTRLAKWNGSNWERLLIDQSPEVNAIVVHQGDFFVGVGNFLYRLDNGTFFPVANIVGVRINALYSDGNKLFVGGFFSSIDGISTMNVAMWDGQSWEGLRNGVNGEVSAIISRDDIVYVSGDFSKAGIVDVSKIAMFNDGNWYPLKDGVIAGTVTDLAVDQTHLYIGGNFTRVDNIIANKIAKWDGNNWSALGSGVSGAGGQVGAITILNNEVIVGGSFTTAGGIDASKVAKWNGSNWAPMGNGLVSFSSFGGVFTFTHTNDGLYAGGLMIPPIGYWDIGCATECPVINNVTGLEKSNIKYASQSINSDAQIHSGSTVTYSANDCILLDFGFSIPADSYFEALLDGCN